MNFKDEKPSENGLPELQDIRDLPELRLVERRVLAEPPAPNWAAVQGLSLPGFEISRGKMPARPKSATVPFFQLGGKAN